MCLQGTVCSYCWVTMYSAVNEYIFFCVLSMRDFNKNIRPTTFATAAAAIQKLNSPTQDSAAQHNTIQRSWSKESKKQHITDGNKTKHCLSFDTSYERVCANAFSILYRPRSFQFQFEFGRQTLCGQFSCSSLNYFHQIPRFLCICGILKRTDFTCLRVSFFSNTLKNVCGWLNVRIICILSHTYVVDNYLVLISFSTCLNSWNDAKI